MASETHNETAPTAVKRTVPSRKPNGEYRVREYLTADEVNQLMDAAKEMRDGHRNATMILIAFRHGLRASELVNLRWDQVDLDGALLHVRRVKGGQPSTHPLQGRELRALHRLNKPGPFVFVSERGAPFTTAGFTRMLQRAASIAGLDGLRVHPHMLRHSCGFHLAQGSHDTRAIQLFLGHREIKSTTRYMDMAASRFDGFFKD